MVSMPELAWLYGSEIIDAPPEPDLAVSMPELAWLYGSIARRPTDLSAYLMFPCLNWHGSIEASTDQTKRGTHGGRFHAGIGMALLKQHINRFIDHAFQPVSMPELAWLYGSNTPKDPFLWLPYVSMPELAWLYGSRGAPVQDDG